jgi:homoserine trans-succinylase
MPLQSPISTKNKVIDQQYFKKKKRKSLAIHFRKVAQIIFANWLIWFTIFAVSTFFTDSFVKSILLPLFALISLLLK